jgi:acyl-CoA reductase-like NAD-dependent aldehyde dehydrogenase
VLTNVKPGTPFAYEETFGPVVSVIEVKDEEEAVAVANDTTYGLSASVFTRDFAKGLAIAERIESGMVHINDQTVLNEPQVPFGGLKATLRWRNSPNCVGSVCSAPRASIPSNLTCRSSEKVGKEELRCRL